MSEVIVTAADWAAGEPRLVFTPGIDETTWLWSILAEESVSNPDGEAMSKLPKSVWHTHLTDASGTTQTPGFTVSEIVTLSGLHPGFYLLRFDDLPGHAYAAPTACGIAIAGTVGRQKLDVHGQVVVPIALAGPTVVSVLTTPGF